MHSIYFSVVLAFIASLCSQSAYADCSSSQLDILIESKSASASSWGNLRNNVGSLNFEIARMLGLAETGLETAKPAKEFCPSGCTVAARPQIFFSSLPEKFLTEYDDATLCVKYQEETTASPLQFNNKDFAKLDQFADWFSDFSQGSGTEGKILYNKCTGSCSPQYKSTINPGLQGAYSVNTSVICGPARDKDNNLYVVSVGYRWFCTS